MKKALLPREYTDKPLSYYKNKSADVTKTIEPAPKTIKAAVAASKVDERAIDTPSVESTTCGHYELNPLMSKMLEAELQDVMTKVLKALPDNAKDPAERLVSKRFKNNAGDELRDVIGLNVTKRLLNVHNPLYVKIVFSDQPWRGELAKFINKYNITSFKRVGAMGATFAAKVNNFQDFDKLCTNQNLTMGSNNIRVTVTPCYQFITCPSNLRTCYGRIDSKITKEIPNSSNQGQISVKDTTNKLESKENINKTENTLKADANNAKPAESQASKCIEKKNTSIQQIPAVANKQNVASGVTTSKTNQVATSKEVAPKATIANKTGSANSVVPKVIPTKTNTLTSVNKQVAAKVTPTKPSQAATDKQNTTPKVTPAKPTHTETQKQSPAPKPTAAKPNTTTKVTPVKAATATNQNTAAKVASATTATEAQRAAATSPADRNTSAKATSAKPGTETPKVVAKPATQNTAAKAASATLAQKAATKPTDGNTAANAISAKPGTEPQKVVAKPTNKNAAAIASSDKTATVTPKVVLKSAANQNATVKATPAKPEAQTQKAAAVGPLPNQKPAGKPTTASKLTPEKPALDKKKKVLPKATKPKPITSKKNENDFDELDDHDILALLSGGIVLDEYIESDED